MHLALLGTCCQVASDMWPCSAQPLKDSPLSCYLPSPIIQLHCSDICCCLQVQARLLPYPTLTYADTSRKTDKSGQWNPAKFYQPGNMNSYAFASFTHPVTAPNLQVRSDWGGPREQGAAWEASFSNMCRLPDSQCGTSCMPLLAPGPLSTHCCAAAPGCCPRLLRQEDPCACLCVPWISRCEVALGFSL